MIWVAVSSLATLLVAAIALSFFLANALSDVKAQRAVAKAEAKRAWTELANVNWTQAFFERDERNQPFKAGWHFFAAAESLDLADQPARRRSALLAADHELRTRQVPFVHDGPVHGAALTKDESRLLTWGDDGVVRLWDVPTGRPIRQGRHENHVYGAAFSRDESRVLSWSWDHTARLWDVSSDTPLHRWPHGGTSTVRRSAATSRTS